VLLEMGFQVPNDNLLVELVLDWLAQSEKLENDGYCMIPSYIPHHVNIVLLDHFPLFQV